MHTTYANSRSVLLHPARVADDVDAHFVLCLNAVTCRIRSYLLLVTNQHTSTVDRSAGCTTGVWYHQTANVRPVHSFPYDSCAANTKAFHYCAYTPKKINILFGFGFTFLGFTLGRMCTFGVSQLARTLTALRVPRFPMTSFIFVFFLLL